MTEPLSLKTLSPFRRFFLLTSLVFLGLVVSSILGFLLSRMLFDVDIFRSPELLNSPEKTGVMNSLRTMQVLQSLGTFILPYAVYALLVSGSIFAYAGLHKTPGVFLILMSAAGMICLVPFVNFVATCNEQLPFPKWVIDSEKQAAALTKAFLQMPDIGSLFLSFLIVAVLPAIGEECIFRGALQPLFIRLFRNHHAGIWLTAIVFSAVHMQFMGFFPRMLLGALFGYWYHWSGTLWTSITGHLMNNGFAVLLSFAIQHAGLPVSADTLGASTSDLWLVGVGLIGAVLAIIAFYRNREIQIPDTTV